MWSLEDGSKCYRLTFSKSLAELLAKRTGYNLLKRSFIVGRELGVDEEADSGVYGIVDTRSGKCLRLALSREVANVIRGTNRVVKEAWLL